MTHGAQAIDLHIPRICIYCGNHIAAEGQLCCGFCMQNSYHGVVEAVCVRDPPQASWITRVFAWWRRVP